MKKGKFDTEVLYIYQRRRRGSESGRASFRKWEGEMLLKLISKRNKSFESHPYASWYSMYF